jgi:hypothetical protein
MDLMSGSKPRKITKIDNIEDKLCDYGCENNAKFILEYKYHKKYCCSEKFAMCPNFIAMAVFKKDIDPLEVRFKRSYIITPTRNIDSILKSEKIYNIILEKECWLWIAQRDRDGYGVIGNERNYPMQAHRASYKLFKGEITKGKAICHYCDTPECVNPNHLFIASLSENNTDRNIKGRSANGEKNGMHTKPETRLYGNDFNKKTWMWCNDDGTEIEVENLAKFCREKGIDPQKIYGRKFKIRRKV